MESTTQKRGVGQGGQRWSQKNVLKNMRKSSTVESTSKKSEVVHFSRGKIGGRGDRKQKVAPKYGEITRVERTSREKGKKGKP